jgi:hypothetical protein
MRKPTHSLKDEIRGFEETVRREASRSGVHARVSPPESEAPTIPGASLSQELGAPSRYELRALKDELVQTLAALGRLRRELTAKDARIRELEDALERLTTASS